MSSLRVVAALAGTSTTQLWRIEHGEYALDSLSEIVALADVLQARVTATLGAYYSCRHDSEVDAALPGLIRDLHTSIAAGRDVAQLLSSRTVTLGTARRA